MSDESDDILPEGEDESAQALTKLQQELAEARRERQEYLDGWQRARADFANLKAEEKGKREQLEDSLGSSLALRLIPLIDSFEAARSSPHWESAPEAWRAGIEGVYREFEKLLQDLAIEPYQPQKGEEFNPTEHIATGRIGEGDRIARVERKGYKHKQRIIRPAIVQLGE